MDLNIIKTKLPDNCLCSVDFVKNENYVEISCTISYLGKKNKKIIPYMARSFTRVTCNGIENRGFIMNIAPINEKDGDFENISISATCSP